MSRIPDRKLTVGWSTSELSASLIVSVPRGIHVRDILGSRPRVAERPLVRRVRKQSADHGMFPQFPLRGISLSTGGRSERCRREFAVSVIGRRGLTLSREAGGGVGSPGYEGVSGFDAVVMNRVIRSHIAGALEYIGKCPDRGISASSTPAAVRAGR